MPTNECIPVFEPGTRVTGRCTATVRGKRLVTVSGDITGGLYGTENIRIAECGAGVKAIGVAAHDGAINEEIPLITGQQWVPIPSGAAIAAPGEVQSDGQGRVITLAAGRPVGYCCEIAAGADEDVLVKLYP